MVEAVVSIALQTLSDFLKEEVRFLSGVSSDVRGLEKQLREMQCLLEDVDRRKLESRTMANWIKEITDLSYRAEDAIQTYAFQVSSKKRGGFSCLLGGFSCAVSETYAIGNEISDIKSEFETITKSMQEYGIRSIIHGENSTTFMGENGQWKRKTFPSENDDCFVGREDELLHLVSLIIDEEQPKFISIWGMGGIGKTTITRKIYHHSDIKRSFKCFAWVCITQKCQIRHVLIEILRQLSRKTNEDVMMLSDEELVEKLCDIQGRERCLIVCDDIWEVDHWNGLKHVFLVEGFKSKIILTTRKKDVADRGYAFELGFLNLDDGWELLKRKAFPYDFISSGMANVEASFEQIGKEMVKRCGNLPLVISLLGGVLSKKHSKEEWESAYTNGYPYLVGGKGIGKKSEIQEVFDLSYDELPYYLKPCFLFMSQFSQDRKVSARALCMSWIAHGMIVHEHQMKDMTLMDVATLYLIELASRCMVLVEVGNPIQENRKCHLHAVVRDLCLLKVKQEDFRLNSIYYQGGKFSILWNKTFSGGSVRYLTIYFEKDIEPEGKCTTTDGSRIKNIHGLQLYNLYQEKKIEFPHTVVDFRKFKLLKVLQIIRFSFAGGKPPREIGYLIHLSSLVLQQCEMDRLPSSISNLRNLISLDLTGTANVKIPNVIKEMSQLKELYLPIYDTENIRNYCLLLDGLDQMETLIGFNSMLHDTESLKTMKNIRSFVADIYDSRSLSSIIETITQNWKTLCTCFLCIYEGCRFIEAEDGKGLEILKSIFTFTGVLGVSLYTNTGTLLQMFETEMIKSGLVYLFLNSCRIEDDPMEVLGKIPLLEELGFYSDSFLGEEMKCHASGFTQLKKLHLHGLPNLRQWNVEDGAMPQLSCIEIGKTPQLEMIPDGLRFIKTLQELKIEGIPLLGRRVSASLNDGGEGEDYNKVRHVPSIIIIDG